MKFAISLIGAVITSFAASAVVANAPNVQTPGPVIYLADNLDEPASLGWCVDTVGEGQSGQLQAHSCKPEGGDVQFWYDAETQQITSVTFAGQCASYGGNTTLTMVSCSSVNSQRFTYDDDGLTFSPASDVNLCLAVGTTSSPAGEYMTRSLVMESCSTTDDVRKSWIIIN